MFNFSNNIVVIVIVMVASILAQNIEPITNKPQDDGKLVLTETYPRNFDGNQTDIALTRREGCKGRYEECTGGDGHCCSHHCSAIWKGESIKVCSPADPVGEIPKERMLTGAKAEVVPKLPPPADD